MKFEKSKHRTRVSRKRTTDMTSWDLRPQEENLENRLFRKSPLTSLSTAQKTHNICKTIKMLKYRCYTIKMTTTVPTGAAN